MADNKKSFVLYADLIGMVEKLPNEKAGELFKIILEYVNDRHPQIDDLLLQIAFEPIKAQLKRDLESWDKAIKDKSINGRMGNLKRWNIDLYNKVKDEELSLDEAENIANNRKTSPSDENDTGATNNIANIAVNDTITVNDTVNNTVTVKKKVETSVEVLEKRKRVEVYLLKYFANKYVTKSAINTVIDLEKEYTSFQIDQAIRFGTNDDFWKAQFLSPNKLKTKNKEGVLFIDLFLAKSKPMEPKQPKPFSTINYDIPREDYFGYSEEVLKQRCRDGCYKEV